MSSKVSNKTKRARIFKCFSEEVKVKKTKKEISKKIVYKDSLGNVIRVEIND